MLPQDGGSASIWDLNSPAGRIASVVNQTTHGTSAKLSFVQATPGLASPWLSLTGAMSGTNYSLQAAKNVSANDYYYNTTGTCNYNTGRSSGSYSSKRIWDHIVELYSLIGSVKGYVDDRESATHTWVGQQGYATQSWVNGQGYATQSWVNGQGYAVQSWVNDVAKQFYSHVHSTMNQRLVVPNAWDTYGTVVTSHITGSVNLANYVTGPAS